MNFKKGEVLFFNKPFGWTSFKVVGHARYHICRRIGVKKLKVGHAGTLDPLATGVMIVCTGKATKRIEEFQYHTKEYVATLRLGATTPSYDLEHEIDATYPTEHITRELVEEVLTHFIGAIDQVPPAFSACMVDGKRAYELARKGEEVELKAKQLVIDEIELLECRLDDPEPMIQIRVVCSKGTYIRALARDIGEALHSGAHLTETIIIAIVEGLTEFLPVSSTGHMIITQNILGVESTEFVKAFTVIIQFGAILSVVCLYWKRFFRLNHTPAPAGASALKCFLHKFDFYWKLLVAFIPAAILGFLFSDKIDEMLESVAIVAVMLVIGGIFMLFCDKIFSKGSEDTVLTERKAFNIGLFQCIAMIPGVSRSMATIVGGMAQKLTRKDAAEFSFFLAVPTMFAATGYKVLKLFLDGGTEILVNNMPALIIGNVVAFIVALLAIKFFISFVTKYGFKAFGWYRIIVGGTILVMLLLGYNLEIG